MKCSWCHEEKSPEDFYKIRRFSRGRAYVCRVCQQAYHKEYRARNRARLIEQSKVYCRVNSRRNVERMAKWRKMNPKQRMLHGLKRRAKARGLECTITSSDFDIPEVCPILGIPLVSTPTIHAGSPSLDRVDNSLGYIPGNVRVISLRANAIKNSATYEEIERLYRYMVEHKFETMLA